MIVSYELSVETFMMIIRIKNITFVQKFPKKIIFVKY